MGKLIGQFPVAPTPLLPTDLLVVSRNGQVVNQTTIQKVLDLVPAAPGGSVNSVNNKTGNVVLDKTDIGLANVDNTTDANKPVSSATQTALNAKQNTLTAGTNITIVGNTISASGGGGVSSVAGKTGAVTLNSSDVGLANVDNTSDINKPVSSAQQTALNAKQNALTAGSNITIVGNTINAAPSPVTSVASKTGAVTLTSSDVGLGNVDNTSDVNKPISTAQAGALALASVQAVKYRSFSAGLTLNNNVVGLSVNTSTNVETISNTSNWEKSRKKVMITDDAKAGEKILICIPLFYTRFYGSASAADRIIYDKMFENPLRWEVTLETVFVNANTGLNTSYNIAGTVAANAFFNYDPATYSGAPYVDFEFILDRDIYAGQFVGVKVYVEDTNGSLPCRLPQGKGVTKSSTVDNFEYIIRAATNTTNTNSRGTIQTETSFTMASSDTAAALAFGAFAILKKHSRTVWGIDADSIGEGAYDEFTSNGTAVVQSDVRGDKYGNAGWFAVYTGSKLKEPHANVSRGTDQICYHTPSYVAAMAVKPAAYPSGNITTGNYLRLQLLDHCGVNKVIEGNGTNDFAASRTGAQVIASKKEAYDNYFAVFSQFPAIYPSFILPKGKPADSSANGIPSPLGQTHESYNRALISGNNSGRQLLKYAIITGASGLPIAGYIDPCQTCENDPINGDGFWKSFLSTFLYQFAVGDSTHPHNLGAQIIGHGAQLSSPNQYQKTQENCLISEGMLNLNSTGNQQLYVNPAIRAYKVDRIVVWGATTGTALVNLSASAAQVAVYGDSGSTLVIAANQTITGLTDLTKILELALGGAAAGNIFTGNLFLKLGTAHGSAAYFNLAVFGKIIA